MKPPRLVTDQLVLETTKLAHAPFLFRLMNSADWIRYIGNRNIKTVEDAENYIRQSILPQLESHGHTSFTITLRSSGLPIGICGLYVRDGLEAPDLGFAIIPEYRGRGLVKEASQCLLKFGFESLNLKTILAITLPENKPSRYLLEKLGFKAIGDLQLPGHKEVVIKYIKSPFPLE